MIFNSFFIVLGILNKYPENTTPRKFYIRRNNNEVNSIETGRIVIGHLLP